MTGGRHAPSATTAAPQWETTVASNQTSAGVLGVGPQDAVPLSIWTPRTVRVCNISVSDSPLGHKIKDLNQAVSASIWTVLTYLRWPWAWGFTSHLGHAELRRTGTKGRGPPLEWVEKARRQRHP